MPPRPFEKIADSFVTNATRKDAKLRKKMVANKERNWLLGIVLHSFSKLNANQPLSDLEKIVVDAFRANGFTDDQMKKHGAHFAKMQPALRNELFPGKYAQLTPQTSYTVAELRHDAPSLNQNVLSMRNVTNIDPHAVHRGTVHLADVPMVSRAVLREFGGSMLVASSAITTAVPTAKYRIKATSFRCNDETGWDWTGSDEPYWLFGAVGAASAQVTRSQVFGDVDTGESRMFSATDGNIWGQDGSAQPVPDELGVMIQLWEHDYGDPTMIKAGFAAAFAAAAGILAATGVAAWIAAVVAGVGAVVQWMLGYIDEDHIGDQTFVFSRQALEDQLNKAGQSMVVTRRFTDGDGDYTLKITVSRTA